VERRCSRPHALFSGGSADTNADTKTQHDGQHGNVIPLPKAAAVSRAGTDAGLPIPTCASNPAPDTHDAGHRRQPDPADITIDQNGAES
jgi:hypothetical protein